MVPSILWQVPAKSRIDNADAGLTGAVLTSTSALIVPAA
jgi:hypothetical protein